jgi:glucose dehydrogenase
MKRNTNIPGRRVRRLMVVLVAATLMVACGGSRATPAPTPSAAGSWVYPNGDLANTRNALGSTISSANVSKLEQAWSFHLPGNGGCAKLCGVQGYGFLAANPIVSHGVVYIQDLNSNVYALALASGSLKWEFTANAPCRPRQSRPARAGSLSSSGPGRWASFTR